eukprot:TRINITY_DN4243_c0_g1_i1.p1 TRINITY_DN4243_c0_g1~~TRINITY_DN4243_c0_g1_i1.p1  ORF type:complete len:764 (-),score=227.24 TRINITY_DN4243_c0_g1_i1:236-2527(-)
MQGYSGASLTTRGVPAGFPGAAVDPYMQAYFRGADPFGAAAAVMPTAMAGAQFSNAGFPQFGPARDPLGGATAFGGGAGLTGAFLTSAGFAEANRGFAQGGAHGMQPAMGLWPAPAFMSQMQGQSQMAGRQAVQQQQAQMGGCYGGARGSRDHDPNGGTPFGGGGYADAGGGASGGGGGAHQGAARFQKGGSKGSGRGGGCAGGRDKGGNKGDRGCGGGRGKGQQDQQQYGADGYQQMGYGQQGMMGGNGVVHGPVSLFCASLPEGCSKEQVSQAFAACGSVMSVRLLTKNNRTNAVVKMANQQDADRALRTIPRQQGWSVKYDSMDGDGKGKGGDRQAAFGTGGKAPNFGPSMGFGDQWQQQQPQMTTFGGSSRQQGGKGKGKSERSRGEPSSNLYVRGLPLTITEGQLHRTFNKVGKVVELKILRYADSQECSALVRMDSVESATAGIDTLNGSAPEGVVQTLRVSFQGKGATTPSDNLYVKGLPPDCTSDDLQMLFSQCGTVRRCCLLPPGSNATTASDAVALVQMSSTNEASKAIQALNGKLPPGAKPQMWIRFAEAKSQNDKELMEPTNNLYVKGLPLGTPNYLLRCIFGQHGTVTWLRVMAPKDPSESGDCVALVEMSTVEEAKAAVEALHGKVLSAPQPPMRVRFAGKEQKPGANLYIAGLAPTIQEQQLHQTFEKVGKVVRLRLLEKAESAETHALVQMGSLEEAEKAIEELNDVCPDSSGPMLIVRYARERIQKDGEKKAESTTEEAVEVEGEG